MVTKNSKIIKAPAPSRDVAASIMFVLDTPSSMPANNAINDAFAPAITVLALPSWAPLLLGLAALLILTVLLIWLRNRESSAPAQAINSPAPPLPPSQLVRPGVQEKIFSDNPNEGASGLDQGSGGLAGDDDDHALLLSPKPEAVPYLILIEGRDPGRRHDISSDRVTIGRDSKRSDILLTDRRVGRVQARIVRKDEHYFLYGSQPGRAWVNGKDAASGIQLNHQDIIQLGPTKWQFIESDSIDRNKS